MESGARALDPKLGLKVQVAECSIDAGGRLLFRDRFWVPGAPFTSEAEARAAPAGVEGPNELRGKLI